jgi:hypothetical protein
MDNKAIFQEYIVPECDVVLHFRLWQSYGCLNFVRVCS